MNTSNKKAIKAASWYTISNFISKASLYIFTPLYIRLLSKSEYGLYNNFLAWQSVLLIIFSFNLSSSINTAYIDYKNKNKFNGFITTISIASIILPLILMIIILLYNTIFIDIFGLELKYLIILLSYLTFGNTLTIFQIEQMTIFNYKIASLLTITVSISSVITTLLLLYFIDDKLLAILIGNTVITVFVSLFLTIYIIHKNRKIKYEYFKYAFIYSLPLIPHLISTSILNTSGRIMISKYCGNEKAALFSLIYTISMVLMLIVSSINKAWIPWFFKKLSNDNIIDIQIAIGRIFPFVCLSTLGICLVGPEIVFIIGGSEYMQSINLLPAIVLHCFIFYIYTLYVNIEFYNKKTVGIALATITIAIINVLLNYIFIIFFDYIAVAYATFISSLLLLLFHVYNVKTQKMLYVFNNILFVKLATITIILSLSSIVLYNYTIVRFLFILIISIMFLLLYKKYIGFKYN